MYTASFIKYASHAFDVVPVVREGREIALSIGKINDEERAELITGREFGKRKEKRKITFIVIFRGEKEGRKEGFFVCGIFLPRLFILEAL